MRRPGVIFQSTSIWDLPSETIAPGRNAALDSIRFHDTKIKEVQIDMTTINVDAILAMVPLLDKQAQEKIVLDIVFKHEIGCTCSMCEAIKLRYPLPDADHPDRFAEQGGEHQTFPFDATNTVQLQSIAKSLGVIAVAVERTSSALESARDVLRGRDDKNEKVSGPLRVIADFLLRGQSVPPQTQRNPVQQQLPIQPPANAPPANAHPVNAPAQASPYAAQKRIATDAEMSRFKTDQKVRFDPKHWPGDSHKGRTLIQCEPNFLEIYADQIEWFAFKAKEKVAAGTADDNAKRDAQWGELNAAQYRRLAADMRTGRVQQAAPPPPAYSGSDLI
jgi:hypothetical protein